MYMPKSFVYQHRDGVKRTMHVEDENKFHISTEVQLDAVLESIKRDRDNLKAGATDKIVARVPMTIYEQSVREQWDEDDWKRWLNDPDNRCFRVWEGRV